MSVNVIREINRNNYSFKVFNQSSFWKKYNKGGWENSSLLLMDDFLKEDSTFIDLGAWMGPYSLYASCLCNKVYSVEPDSQAFNMFIKNISLNSFMKDKICAFNGGIGNKNGNYTLYNKENSFGNSLSTIAVDNIDNNYSKIEVPFMTLDTFVEKQNITSCDFIKIDIEGGEYIIFEMLENFLRKYKPSLLISIHHFVFNNIDRTVGLLKSIEQIYGDIYNVKYKKINMSKEWISWLSKKRIINIMADNGKARAKAKEIGL